MMTAEAIRTESRIDCTTHMAQLQPIGIPEKQWYTTSSGESGTQVKGEVLGKAVREELVKTVLKVATGFPQGKGVANISKIDLSPSGH